MASKSILVKIGGSSITHKDSIESLDENGIQWFAKSIKQAMQSNRTFVIVHGAGSFGHYQAKQYGLRGQSDPPNNTDDPESRQRQMEGLVHTRLSVQKLNQLLVKALVDTGVKAVAISPAFGFGMQAHGGDKTAQDRLRETIFEAISAGLVPVIHGDACLYGRGAGILSGDTLMQIIGEVDWISEAIFITDVDGVFSKDPRSYSDAVQIPLIEISKDGEILSSSVEASESSHEHDVTGGLKTKLGAAISIAMHGKNVHIVCCNKEGSTRILCGDMDAVGGTLIRR